MSQHRDIGELASAAWFEFRTASKRKRLNTNDSQEAVQDQKFTDDILKQDNAALKQENAALKRENDELTSQLKAQAKISKLAIARIYGLSSLMRVHYPSFDVTHRRYIDDYSGYLERAKEEITRAQEGLEF